MLTNQTAPEAPRTVDRTAQLAELVVRTARRLHRSTQPAFGAIGLTNAQARVVRHLEHAGRPVRMADIAAALEVVPRTATSVVDDLEASGLVVRATDPNDRRSLLVTLTPAGARLLARLAEARRRTADELFGPLSAADQAELTRLLEALCDGADTGRPAACRGSAATRTGQAAPSSPRLGGPSGERSDQGAAK